MEHNTSPPAHCVFLQRLRQALQLYHPGESQTLDLLAALKSSSANNKHTHWCACYEQLPASCAAVQSLRSSSPVARGKDVFHSCDPDKPVKRALLLHHQGAVDPSLLGVLRDKQVSKRVFGL